LNTLSDKQFEAALADGGKPSIDEIIGRSAAKTGFTKSAADVFSQREAAYLRVIKNIESEFHDSGKARRARVVGPLISNEQLKAAYVASAMREISRIESEIESVSPDEVHLFDLLRQVRGELMRIEYTIGCKPA
jgi:hypothetical protein